MLDRIITRPRPAARGHSTGGCLTGRHHADSPDVGSVDWRAFAGPDAVTA